MAKKVSSSTKRKITSPKAAIKKKDVKKASAKRTPANKKAPRNPAPSKKKGAPKFSLAKAKEFVKNVKIPIVGVRRGIAGEKPPVPFTEGMDQTLVVGSDIVSLSSTLSEEQRKLVVNSLLLAQLAATAKVTDKKNIKGWYSAYFDTLAKIGWLIQDTGFTAYKSDGSHLQVNKAIIKIAAVVFGPAATALTIVTTTLNAFSEMSENAPWITIFKRSSESSTVSRFQITTAEASEKGTMIHTMAFELKTKNNLTQVLVFKVTTAEVTLNHASGKVTLDSTLSSTLAPAIEKRVAAHLLKNIEEIEI